jgi:hypothetical protein
MCVKKQDKCLIYLKEKENDVSRNIWKHRAEETK